MNCSTFKKKIFDYLEDSIQYDMNLAMEKHIMECKECRILYEEEKSIDDALKGTLNFDDIKFNSSRSNIMKGIDKNKYSGSVMNKIKFHLKRYHLRYISYAAIFMVSLFTVPFLSNMIQSRDLSFQAKHDSVAQKGELSITESKVSQDNGSIAMNNKEVHLGKETEEVGNEESKASMLQDESRESYIPKFNKVDSTKDPEKGMATVLKSSPNGKLKAQLDGRGISAEDEGVAEIFILDASSNKWRLQLMENDARLTPMYLEWADNENVLITMGLSDGHATAGGSVYKVNVYSGTVSLFYEVDSTNEQVTTITRIENAVKLKVKIFTDDIQNNYREEERIISIQ